MLTCRQRKCTRPRRPADSTCRTHTGFKRFPFNNFTYCLTLFSKFFSSFPHGTCSLSVSRHIFSFRWNLPPILGCIPKQPDSLRDVSHSVTRLRVIDGTLTLYGALFQRTCTQATTENASLNYNSARDPSADFKFELFPLHSPLLGESLLVSFPPLIDMLKFSG